MSKNLVAYFSASGVTAELARLLARAADAELFEIRPKTPYTKADLDWTDKQSRSFVERKDPNFRPEIEDKTVSIEKYDVIFLGFPIWWHIAPPVINTFLERYDFSGKTIIPFATSGGNGMGRTAEVLKPSVSDKAVWKEGRLLNGNPTEEALAAWVESLR